MWHAASAGRSSSNLCCLIEILREVAVHFGNLHCAAAADLILSQGRLEVDMGIAEGSSSGLGQGKNTRLLVGFFGNSR